jgi:hypothetical protein
VDTGGSTPSSGTRVGGDHLHAARVGVNSSALAHSHRSRRSRPGSGERAPARLPWPSGAPRPLSGSPACPHTTGARFGPRHPLAVLGALTPHGWPGPPANREPAGPRLPAGRRRPGATVPSQCRRAAQRFRLGVLAAPVERVRAARAHLAALEKDLLDV